MQTLEKFVAIDNKSNNPIAKAAIYVLDYEIPTGSERGSIHTTNDRLEIPSGIVVAGDC